MISSRTCLASLRALHAFVSTVDRTGLPLPQGFDPSRFVAVYVDGRIPALDARIINPDRARRINALMLTCGHYDGSGDFAFSVGLPGKSGVGGGVLAVAPGTASIAVWSPGLDAKGNSLLGRVALERLARAMQWSVFG